MHIRTLCLALLLALPLAARAQPSSDALREIDGALRLARAERICGAEAGLVERARAAHARLRERSTAAYVEAAGARLLACVADLPAARQRAVLAGGAPIGATERRRIEVGAVRATAGEGAIDVAIIERIARAMVVRAARCADELAPESELRGELVLAVTYGTTGDVTAASVVSEGTGSHAVAGCVLDSLSRVRVSRGPDRPASFTIVLRFLGAR